MNWPEVTLACISVVTWGLVMIFAIRRDPALGFCLGVVTVIGGCVALI